MDNVDKYLTEGWTKFTDEIGDIWIVKWIDKYNQQYDMGVTHEELANNMVWKYNILELVKDFDKSNRVEILGIFKNKASAKKAAKKLAKTL